MKTVLILDDRQDRFNGFMHLFPDWKFFTCKTFSSAITTIRQQPRLDAVFLDHDLAEGDAKKDADFIPGFNHEDKRYLNGQDFCLALRDLMGKFDTEQKLPPRALIHSWNAWGAEEMNKILNCVFAPAWFKTLVWPMPGPVERCEDINKMTADHRLRVLDFKTKIEELMK